MNEYSIWGSDEMVRKTPVFLCLFSTHKQYYVFMSRLVNVLSRDFVVPVSCVGLLELPQKFMFLMVMRKREFPIVERLLCDHKTMI